MKIYTSSRGKIFTYDDGQKYEQREQRWKNEIAGGDSALGYVIFSSIND